MPRRLPEVTPQVGLSRGDRSALNLPMPGSSGIEALAGLGADLSAAGAEIVRQRDTARMLRQISDIQMQTQQRMQELSLQGTGDRQFAEVAVEEFAKTANDFIAQQPAYLRDAARQKMLQMRDTVATTALAVQADMAAKELAADTEAHMNNLVNQVRLGTLSEAEALAQGNEFIDNSLPPTAQRDARDDMSQMMKLANLNRLVELDPVQAKRLIQTGKYNDLRPDRLAEVMRAADRAIESQRAALVRRQQSIWTDFLKGDLAAGAVTALELNGEDITVENLLRVQSEFGIHPDNVSVITKEQAQAEWLRVGPDVENTVNGVVGFLDKIYHGYANKEHGNIAVRDFIKFTDAPAEMKEVMGKYIEMKGDMTTIPPDQTQYYEVALRTMGESKGVETAFKSKYGDKATSYNNKFDSKFNEQIEPVLQRAGASSTQINSTRERMRRVFQQEMNENKTVDEARRIATAQWSDMKERKGLALPSDIFDRWAFSGPTGETHFKIGPLGFGPPDGEFVSRREGVLSEKSRRIPTDVELKNLALTESIKDKKLIVPPRIDPDVFYDTVMRDAEWVNGLGVTRSGDMFLRLIYNGHPVMRIVGDDNRAEEVRIPFNHLRVLLEDLD